MERNFNRRVLYTSRMALYEQTMKMILNGQKNNLQEKLRGSNKFEFKELCNVLEQTYHLNKNSILGLGTSCIVYNYSDSYVIKVCAKKIKFFHYRASKSGHEFKKISDPLSPYFLPVTKVIYDGGEFFAYVQRKCQPLSKKGGISDKNLTDILNIIESMLTHGLLVGQLKPKNVGYYQDRLVLFDYHSMHPLYQRMKDKEDWWFSMVDSLTKYDDLFRRNMSDVQNLIVLIKASKTPADISKVVTAIRQLKTKLVPPPPKAK